MPVRDLGLRASTITVDGLELEVEQRFRPVDAVQHRKENVYAAEDTRTGERVAIKKVDDVLEDATIARGALRELRMMRHLQHENLIGVRSIFFFGPKESLTNIYVVSEAMDSHLAAILRSGQPLTKDHFCFLLYQILRGMKYVHSANVIHGDLTPRNMLINSSCDLKICGFGLNWVSTTNKEWHWTEAGQWYCAPEVLGCGTGHSKAIDIWSIGCIVAEMYLRRPLFPSCTPVQHFNFVVGLLGLPTGNELANISNKRWRNYLLTSTTAQPKRNMTENLSDLIPEASEPELDLLSKMLQWDPASRVSVEDAIQHPYLDRLYCPEDEPTRGPLDLSDFKFEVDELSEPELREELFREVLHYYPELKEAYDDEWKANVQMISSLRQLCRAVHRDITHHVLYPLLLAEETVQVALLALAQCAVGAIAVAPRELKKLRPPMVVSHRGRRLSDTPKASSRTIEPLSPAFDITLSSTDPGTDDEDRAWGPKHVFGRRNSA